MIHNQHCDTHSTGGKEDFLLLLHKIADVVRPAAVSISVTGIRIDPTDSEPTSRVFLRFICCSKFNKAASVGTLDVASPSSGVCLGKIRSKRTPMEVFDSRTVRTLEDLCVGQVAVLLIRRGERLLAPSMILASHEKYANPFHATCPAVVDKLFVEVTSILNEFMFYSDKRLSAVTRPPETFGPDTPVFLPPKVPICYSHVELLLASRRLRTFQLRQCLVDVSELAKILGAIMDNGSTIEEFILSHNTYITYDQVNKLPVIESLSDALNNVSPTVERFFRSPCRFALKSITTEVPVLVSSLDPMPHLQEALVHGSHDFHGERGPLSQEIRAIMECAPNLSSLSGDLVGALLLFAGDDARAEQFMPLLPRFPRLRVLQFTEDLPRRPTSVLEYDKIPEPLFPRKDVETAFTILGTTCPFLSKLVIASVGAVSTGGLRALCHYELPFLKNLMLSPHDFAAYSENVIPVDTESTEDVKEFLDTFGPQLEVFWCIPPYINVELGQIAERCPKLRDLNLTIMELDSLKFWANNESATQHRPYFHRLERLTLMIRLHIGKLPAQKAKVMYSLLVSCKNLKYLDIRGNPEYMTFLDDDFLEGVLKTNPLHESLKTLSMHNTSLTSGGLQRIEKQYLSGVQVWITISSHVTDDNI